MFDWLVEVGLCCGLHLLQDHGANLLRGVDLLLALVHHLDEWLVVLVHNLVWEQFDVSLDLLVIPPVLFVCVSANFVKKSINLFGEGTHERPMRRLISNTVFSGFCTSWFAAASPTRLNYSHKKWFSKMAGQFQASKNNNNNNNNNQGRTSHCQ